MCMRRGGLLERLLRLAVVSKEDHRSSVRAAGARERDGGERATRSCGRRPLASASSQLVPARAKNSLSHETICCDRTPQQAQPSRSFPRLRLAASTRARCAHEPLARSPLSRSSREAQRSSLQHDDGLLAQIQRGSKRSSVVQPSAARRRARGRRAEGAEVALLDLELVEAGRARAAGRRGRVRTSGERGGRRERGTHRVVSTASIGRVKRSSSQPYALGVSLMTVCLLRSRRSARGARAGARREREREDAQRDLDVGQLLLRQVVAAARRQRRSTRRPSPRTRTRTHK